MKQEIIKDAIQGLVYGHVEGRKERMTKIMQIQDKEEKLKQYKEEMGGQGGMTGKNGYYYWHDTQGKIYIDKDDERFVLTAKQIISLETSNLFN